MKSAMRFLFFFFPFAWILAGCQTTGIHDFREVKKGQEKREVLEIMGSPTSTWRHKGQDRWHYVLYDENEARADKEVHFEDGKAVYVGNTPEPEVSAEEKDTQNEKANAEAQKQMEDAWKARYKGYESYEEAVRPTTESKPLPTFREIQ